LTQLNLSEANHLAFCNRFVCQSGFQSAQIVVIQKSNHAPWAYKADEFTSRCTPEKWFAAAAQPPINELALRIETNPAVAILFHERKHELAS